MLTGYENKNMGLIGNPLSHSFSPAIHGYLADYRYTLFPMPEEEVPVFLKSGTFDAINVTIPYKETVIPYLDEISAEARRIGAVNTIVRKDGKLCGYNTDYFGFSYMLSLLSLDLKSKKVLILGSGGAAKTVFTVLTDVGASPTIISRHGENNYENLNRHRDAYVIVNATPVGMYPHNGASPLPCGLADFPNLRGILDLIYNPIRTALLLEAEKRHIPAVNGLSMLVAQAAKATEYFLDTAIDDKTVPAVVADMEKKSENLVFVGMPGCGKSTTARRLAHEIGRPYVDLDTEIEKKAGKSIPDIFKDDGEKVFRDIEHGICEEIGKKTGLVIATGGGVVTRADNYAPLRQNGKIVFLSRPTAYLSRKGRPLSVTCDLDEMLKIRLPLYRRFADTEIAVAANKSETLLRVRKELNL